MGPWIVFWIFDLIFFPSIDFCWANFFSNLFNLFRSELVSSCHHEFIDALTDLKQNMLVFQTKSTTQFLKGHPWFYVPFIFVFTDNKKLWVQKNSKKFPIKAKNVWFSWLKSRFKGQIPFIIGWILLKITWKRRCKRIKNTNLEFIALTLHIIA